MAEFLVLVSIVLLIIVLTQLSSIKGEIAQIRRFLGLGRHGASTNQMPSQYQQQQPMPQQWPGQWPSGQAGQAGQYSGQWPSEPSGQAGPSEQWPSGQTGQWPTPAVPLYDPMTGKPFKSAAAAGAGAAWAATSATASTAASVAATTPQPLYTTQQFAPPTSPYAAAPPTSPYAAAPPSSLYRATAAAPSTPSHTTAAAHQAAPPSTYHHAAPPSTYQQAALPSTPPYSAPAPRQSFENVFGKNIIGVIAAILVFVGLIFLGFLVVPFIGDTIKILLMFVLSAALTATGFILNRRYSNNFTKALLGTGCGAFFISIQITHLYFGAINEVVAYLLLLVWIAASFVMVRLSQSLLVGIITHAGMVFSVCAGYLVGLTSDGLLLAAPFGGSNNLADDKLVLLMGYQLASTVLIIVGNILCSKKMYRFGLFASLALTVFASLVMWLRFIGYGAAFATSLPTALIVTAFIVQLIGSSFLAYMLLLSIIRVKDKHNQSLLTLLNTALWLVTLGLNLTLLLGKLYMVVVGHISALPFMTFETVPLAFGVSLLIVVALALFMPILKRVLKFSTWVETPMLLLLLGFAFLLLSTQAVINSFDAGALQNALSPRVAQTLPFGPRIPYYILLVLVCIGIQRLSKNQLFAGFAVGIAAFDTLLLLGYGYMDLTNCGTILASIAYLATMLACMFIVWHGLEPSRRQRLATPARIAALLVYEVSMLYIMLFSYPTVVDAVVWFPTSLPLFLISILLPLLALHFFKKERPYFFFRINELVVVLAAAYIFGSRPMLTHSNPLPIVLSVIALALICLLLVDRVRCAAIGTAATALRFNNDFEVLIAIEVYLLTIAVLIGQLPGFDLGFELSFASMAIALVLVVLGLWARTRALRVFGLCVVIASVLKLAILDISGLDTAMRVIAFIGGGLICFGISALYNFAVKRLGTARELQQAQQAPPQQQPQVQQPPQAQPQQQPQPQAAAQEDAPLSGGQAAQGAGVAASGGQAAQGAGAAASGGQVTQGVGAIDVGVYQNGNQDYAGNHQHRGDDAADS